MRIAKAIRDDLRLNAGVTAYTSKRIYLRRAPGKVTGADFPYIIISLQSAAFQAQSQADVSAASVYWVTARVQIDSYHSDQTLYTAEEAVETLSEKVSERLNAMASATGTIIQGITMKRPRQVDEQDNFEWLRDGSDGGIHRIMQVWEIKYQQPTTA